ncbi:MAG: AMP-binding protein [Candidatus Latescibacteria bacterium]|nr:AMP-binding protein [Candidatus Latescibacterota bacterium]NIM21791.1 AMP-binding protein [Candidatus Latescibacterota bacterium]NIM65929.1 AMP-binding protein [Candidatus Latescibacterota bacterium]NIO02674.1 AMP-binding protein [Candidatus Latescibacterota bacterium]NIO29655.1 AMP-binding protein [Candidatus Latescibacterota bacterium]
MAAETIPQLFLQSVRKFQKADAFRVKQHGSYTNISHKEIFDKTYHAALGLLTLRLTKGDRVALLSENRPEWVIADLAILSAGCINVPIYTSLPAAQIAYILRDAEARAIFVSDANQLSKILEIRSNLPALRRIITFDPHCAGDEAISLDKLIETGASLPNPKSYEEMISTIGKYDWASIIYTSGTTGEPKGAILTHWNFVTNAITCVSIIDVSREDTFLSWLPLSHVFERTGGYYTPLHVGATIAYAESMDTIPQDLIEVKPTVMISVPRFYEKTYARIMDMATSGPRLKKYLFFWALDAGRAYVKQKLAGRVSFANKLKYAIADKLVLFKIRERTGGRLRFAVAGGAPLHRKIAEFFYAVGLPILEGYGLTETSPAVAINTFEAFKFGTVGRPIPGVEVQTAEDGEILVKGPNVMLGYFKKPDMTNEVIVDEWFHTGDIGFIDREGFLSITDRKKDIIVTAGGKNVAPQPIECAIKTSKYIAQAVLIGDKRKFISALIVPNFDNIKKYALSKQIPYTDMASLLKNPKVHEKIQSEIDRKSENFASFERIKKFVLLDHDFSIDSNELTPSLKVRRNIVEKEFKEHIDKLYEEDEAF